MFCFCTFPLSNFNISIFILVLYYIALLNRLLLFICKRTSVLGVCYLFAKDCGPSLPVLYIKAAVLITHFVYKDCCPCLLLFICKGLLSLSFCHSIAKDCCPCLVLFTCKGLHLCLVLFTCKRLRSLSSGIHSQRTAVLVLCYSFAKDCGSCLWPLVCKETAVLIFCFCPSKIKMDCSHSKAWGTAFLPGLVKMAVS